MGARKKNKAKNNGQPPMPSIAIFVHAGDTEPTMFSTAIGKQERDQLYAWLQEHSDLASLVAHAQRLAEYPEKNEETDTPFDETHDAGHTPLNESRLWGRKPKNETRRQFNVRVSNEELHDWQETANQTGTTITRMIRTTMNNHIKQNHNA
jgi:hypothetical protein